MKLLILDYTANIKNYEHIFKAVNTLEYDLIGFVSLDNQRINEKIEGYPVYPLNYLHILKYDFALFNAYFEVPANIVFSPLAEKLNIPLPKIKSVYWLLQQIMTKKYEDIQDSAIQETLNYWQNHELTVFNQHTENYPHTYNEMFVDESCGLSYIMFETVEGKKRRMYFPQNGGERVKGSDGKTYIKDIMREQVPTSPHLYITGEHKINDGDILIDAGVCEGNFALRYVDVCSKIYLFEMDSKWIEPLYYSFRDCWDKIELIPKPVADSGGGGGNIGRSH